MKSNLSTYPESLRRWGEPSVFIQKNISDMRPVTILAENKITNSSV